MVLSRNYMFHERRRLMMENKSFDPTLDKAMEFSKHFRQNNNTTGISNLYVLKTVDEDGNITDEKYGMNMMTNYGMTSWFNTTSGNFPTTVYIGQGVGTILASENVLLSSLNQGSTQVSGTTNFDCNYPLYYAPENGRITLVAKHTEQYFNTNQPVMEATIREYGIGSSETNLWTHSWVYDSQGKQSDIVKKINEKLFVTVYFCMSMNESIINDLWKGDPSLDPYVLTRIEPLNWSTNYTNYYTKSGSIYVPVTGSSAPTWNADTYYERVPVLNQSRKYLAFCRMNLFYNRMVFPKYRRYKADNTYVETNNTNYSVSRYDESSASITVTTNLIEFNLNQDNVSPANNTGYFDTFQIGTEIGLTERVLLPTPINFKVVMPYPSDANKIEIDGLSTVFGKTIEFPFTQMVISKACCFNYLTGQYDLEEEIDVDDSVWYNETLDYTTYTWTLYYTVEGTKTPIYLYINMKTDDPILRFYGNSITLYATDSYWDKETWVQITNLRNIPPELRCKRYYLTAQNVPLLPLREKRKFNIRPVNGYPSIDLAFNIFDTTKYSRSYDVSTTRNFFVIGHYLYNMSTIQVINLGTGSESTDRYVTDKHIVVFDDNILTVKNDGTLYVTNYAELNNLTITNPSTITNFMNCMITEGSTNQPEKVGNDWVGKNGLVMFTGSGESLLVRVKSGTSSVDGVSTPNVDTTLIQNTIASCMLNGTTNYAYIDSSADHTINIYDGFTGNQVGSPIDLDSSLATPTFMVGYRDKLYVSDGSTYTYLVDITNGTTAECDNIIAFTSGLNNIRVTSVDDVILIYKNTGIDRAHEYYIRYDTPTEVHTLTGMTVPHTGEQYTSLSSSNSTAYRLYKKYGGIMLVLNCNRNAYSDGPYANIDIFDFGHFMYDSTKTYWTEWTDRASTVVMFGDWLIHQNKVTLLSNYIHHELTGTTNTVTAYNGLKHVSNKEWAVTFTNLPSDSWAGLPQQYPL